MKIKFSIIIPIYNAEKYLHECLSSILNQDYKYFEVIMINDGSIDNSDKICQSYCIKDSRFKLVNQKNSGVSIARNKGIKLANGEFIIFIDSDDVLIDGALKIIEKNICDNDLLCYGYCKYYLDKEENILLKNYQFKNKEDCIKTIIYNQEVGGFLWNKCFKRDIINKKNILFDKNLHYCEDLLFVSEYLKYCNKLHYISKVLYKYRMRKSSVSFNLFSKKNVSMLKSYEKLINKYKGYDDVANRLKFLYIISYYKIKSIIPKNFEVNKSILKNERIVILKEKLNIKEKIIFIIIKYFNFFYRLLRLRKNNRLNLFE